MAHYEGNIDSYVLNISTPNSSNARVMHIRGSFGMAFVNLIPDGEKLDTNRKSEKDDHFYVYLPMNDWEPLVDMLRHESPVNFYFSDETKVASIFTDREPVGEGAE